MKASALLDYADYLLCLPSMARLPVPLAYRLADLRGHFHYRMRKNSRQHAGANLAEVFPNLSNREIRKIVLQHFQVRSRDEMEAFWYRRPLNCFESFLDIDGLDDFRKAIACGKGVLFFCGHLGSLCLSFSILGKHGIAMTIVARSLEPDEIPLHPAVRTYNRQRVAWIEENVRNPFLLTGRGNYPQMVERLRQGHVVVIAIDVPPNLLNPRRTVTVEFFGRPARFADGIASLYRETEARMVHCSVYRTESGRQKIELRDVTDQVHRTASNTEILQKLVGLLEEKIRLRPEQWNTWDSLSLFRDLGAPVGDAEEPDRVQDPRPAEELTE